MADFDWDTDTTSEDETSQDDSSLALEEPEAAAPNQGGADANPDLDDLMTNVPEDQRQVVRDAARRAQRRMEGKWGPVVQDYKQREESYQNRIEELAARANQQGTPARAEDPAASGSKAEQIRSELKSLGVSFENSNSQAQNQQLLQMVYETQVDRYLDKGPGKVFGNDFSDDFRDELKDIIRANGYNVQAPNVLRAFERTKTFIERDRSLRRAEAQNRMQIGTDLSSGTGARKPSDAEFTERGDFDWGGTYRNKIRRGTRG